MAKSKQKRELKKLKGRVTDLEQRLAMVEDEQKKKRIAREWLTLIPMVIRQILSLI